jgi:uncharacterized protein YdhG (YjbR/CyaY superfamily)
VFRPASLKGVGRAARFEMVKSKPSTIDDYIAAYPADIQAILQAIRATVREAAPGATDAISCNMPTFRLGRTLVHFGAFKTHVAFFPPVRDPAIREETLRYQGDRGNLRFPLDEPIPYGLVRRIVIARVQEVGRARDSTNLQQSRPDHL